METPRVSWNTRYRSRGGFECQVSLTDDDDQTLTERASRLMGGILDAGGRPVTRNGQRPRNAHQQETEGESDNGSKNQEKTYVDDNGVRRCSLKLKSGKICNAPVTEREGRYGLFWSCPDFREHARDN